MKKIEIISEAKMALTAVLMLIKVKNRKE